MSGKAGSKCAGDTVQGAGTGIGHGRRGVARRVPPGDGAFNGTLPTMHASARRAVRPAHNAPSTRKNKRVKRPRTLGGRLAAAIRTARLRAGRAAEEFGLRR